MAPRRKDVGVRAIFIENAQNPLARVSNKHTKIN